MEESRARSHADLLKKIQKGEKEIERLGKELRYTQQVVAGELAGWQAWRVEVGKAAVKSLVKEMVIRERERGKGLERVMRRLKEMK